MSCILLQCLVIIFRVNCILLQCLVIIFRVSCILLQCLVIIFRVNCILLQCLVIIFRVNCILLQCQLIIFRVDCILVQCLVIIFHELHITTIPGNFLSLVPYYFLFTLTIVKVILIPILSFLLMIPCFFCSTRFCKMCNRLES